MKYAYLRDRVVNAKLVELRTFQQVAAPQNTIATSQQLFADFNPSGPSHWQELPIEMQFGHDMTGYLQFES